jgi:competence protein ComGC
MPVHEQEDKPFPLAEALVVFLIVVVVTSMLVPTVQRVKRDNQQAPQEEPAAVNTACETAASDAERLPGNSIAENAREVYPE